MMNWLWEPLRWSDLLDIVILAYILYRTILILKGTRAIQVLVGLLSMMLLYVLADRLELVAIQWLLDKLLVYIVLAVIILFQQDIRRGLAKAGGTFFPTFRGNTDVSMIEEIIKASFALASRRIGALIAMERNGSLDEYIEPATQLDAVISHELLQAIFHPNSPLHDGAVVVKDRQLAAAQVFLPLSLTKEVSRFYGTRHRAALGLTEETDAVVIIVSEERGTVAVVIHGEIHPCSDANELRDHLQTIFQHGSAPPIVTAPSS